jgi:hypothetical protein
VERQRTTSAMVGELGGAGHGAKVGTCHKQ